MTANSIELDVLGTVANDYEAPNSITVDLSREIGLPIAESVVTEVLLSLASKGPPLNGRVVIFNSTYGLRLKEIS